MASTLVCFAGCGYFRPVWPNGFKALTRGGPSGEVINADFLGAFEPYPQPTPRRGTKNRTADEDGPFTARLCCVRVVHVADELDAWIMHSYCQKKH